MSFDCPAGHRFIYAVAITYKKSDWIFFGLCSFLQDSKLSDDSLFLIKRNPALAFSQVPDSTYSSINCQHTPTSRSNTSIWHDFSRSPQESRAVSGVLSVHGGTFLHHVCRLNQFPVHSLHISSSRPAPTASASTRSFAPALPHILV